MGRKRAASLLACTAALAGATGAALQPPAFARPSANATTYRSGGRVSKGTHHGLRRKRHFGAHCGRRVVHRHKGATAHARFTHARPAHRHARGTRCGGRRRHRHGGAHKHRRSRRSFSRHTSRKPGAARSSGCADASLTPTREDLDRVRAAVLCLVNRERASAGESALAISASLAAAAQRHTEDMAFGDFFDHTGPHGSTLLSRVRASGYFAAAHGSYELGENIAFGTGWLASPRAIVAGWMASPGHRANILDARFRDTGIGASAHPPVSLAEGQRGAVYTQDFGVLG